MEGAPKKREVRVEDDGRTFHTEMPFDLDLRESYQADNRQ